jgi:hypothetical protein
MRRSASLTGTTWRTAPEGAQRAGSFWTITVRREV